ncbi:hypothetical protein OsJ_21640 [Oryza sativa Japonica Group]|uniref:Uncharacterized protein n=1 Tax=Oryza sativa subsp. japonica TaxID=39947 RepID=B9FTP6_ORYSJ|nr:hypothetical protein OsJ_21640 [Oryza sativa Japonica Group]
MRSLRILSTPMAQRSSAPFIAHCLPLPYLCSVQVVPGIPVSHPPPPSHRRSRLSSTSMGSLDLGAAQEDRRHSRRHTRSSSGFLLLPCRMGLLAGDLLPSHPQWWQLDGSQEKQGKRKGAKRQGKWTVATDRCPLAYCNG